MSRACLARCVILQQPGQNSILPAARTGILLWGRAPVAMAGEVVQVVRRSAGGAHRLPDGVLGRSELRGADAGGDRGGPAGVLVVAEYVRLRRGHADERRYNKALRVV